MQQIRKIVFGILILTQVACETTTKTKDQTSLAFEFDTLFIKTDGHALDMANSPRIYQAKNREYYVNYNHVTHSLYFFDLKQNGFSHKIQFVKSGAHKIQACNNYVVTNSLIFNMTASGLKVLNFDGELTKRLTSKEMLKDTAPTYRLTKPGISIDNLMRMASDKSSKTLGFPVFDSEKSPGEPGFYENSCLAKYNYETNRAELIRIQSPEELMGKYYYGDLATPHICLRDCLLIYHYHFLPRLYIYNLKNHSTHTQSFSMNEMDHEIKGIRRANYQNMIRQLKQLFMQSKIHNLIQDPYRPYYYLVYSVKSERNENGGPSEKHLVVFNNNLEKLGECRLDRSFFPEFCVSEKGLLFRSSEDESYKELPLYVLKVNSKL